MNPRAALLCLIALAAPARAEAPALAAFAEAIALTAQPGQPVQQLDVPDAVYQRVISPALRDVAVFDGAGARVPLVLCPAETTTVETTRTERVTVFPVRLPGTAPGAAATARVTTGEGDVTVTLPGGGEPAVAIAAYDLDLTGQPADSPPVVALLLDWRSPTNLSEVHLAIEHGAEGQPWQPLVTDTVLRRLSAEGQTLESRRIALPPGRYARLRLVPRDAAGTVIFGAEVLRLARAAQAPALRWHAATPVTADAAASPGEAAITFDAGRAAPVTRARLRLATPNTRAVVQLQSRADGATVWRTVWSGEAFHLAAAEGARHGEEVPLPLNTDRHWRVLGAGGVALPALELALGHAPQRLRFVAQGQGPYQLAYGHAAAAQGAGPGACESLLQTLQAGTASAAGTLATLTGTAIASAPRVLAGEAALVRQTDPAQQRRQWLLWGVLALAVLLLLGMARKLFADLTTPKT